jgi:hypothetical protein
MKYEPIAIARADAAGRQGFVDSICIALIVLASVLPYVASLGFYSDDWYVLSTLHFGALQHRSAITFVLHDYAARPVQGLYLVLLYKLFGFHPLGYHLVNSAVIAAAITLFHSLLLRLKVDRASALAASVILVVLPQLSTIRVWYDTFQIPLAMLAALASLHCQLSFARSGRAGWAVAAGFTAVFSIAAYEIFAPFVAAFPLALLVAHRKEPAHRALPLAALVVLVGMAAAAKFAVSNRASAPDVQRYAKGLIQLVRPDYDWRTDYSLNLFAAANVHFWQPFLGFVRAAEALVRGELGPFGARVGIAIASMSFWRLRAAEVSLRSAPNLLLLGIACFLLGHAVFLIAPAMSFSPTGIGNRALVAASLGMALLIVAAALHALRLVSARHRPLLFASAVSAIAFLGTLRIVQIANFWTEAPAIQQHVIAAARLDLKAVPTGSFVMLDGVCPYHGPAVLFEAPWDVSGALSLALDRAIRADAVSPRMSLRPNGLATSIYGEPAHYPFGSSLYVYDPSRHKVAQLRDRRTAVGYFREAKRWRTPCPRAYVGHGVLI